MRPSLADRLGREPLIAASLCGGHGLLHNARRAAQDGADLIEVRIDTFSPAERRSLARVLRAVRKASGLPLIATVRSRREAGPEAGRALSNAQRRALYEAALPFCALLDVELGSDAINRSLVQAAHLYGKLAILSYHDFRSVPSRGKIRALLRKFKALGGDVFKVAGMPSTEGQLQSLLGACKRHGPVPRIFVAMGEKGKLSRVMGFAFGSCLSYGSISRATAPGQVPVRRLKQFLRTLYPSYRERRPAS